MHRHWLLTTSSAAEAKLYTLCQGSSFRFQCCGLLDTEKEKFSCPTAAGTCLGLTIIDGINGFHEVLVDCQVYCEHLQARDYEP